MKKTKIILTVVMCMCIVMSGLLAPSVVQAETNIESTELSQGLSRMAYIATYTTTLSISDTGGATVTGLVRGKSGTNSTYVICTLQRDVSGSWKDVKTWTDSNNNSASTVNTSYQLFSHGTYRVHMECAANDEVKTLNSAYRTY